MKKIITRFIRLFRSCKNCKYSYCFDTYPDWRCKKDRKEGVSDKMIEPYGYCENWSKSSVAS